VAEDKTRFRNLAAAAEELLAGRGVRETPAREMVKSLRKEAERDVFWRQVERGLAAFISPSDFRVFGLPEPPPESVVVGERFLLKPLLAYLGGRGPFYVLAISENFVKLFAGDRYQLAEVEVPGLPANLEEARHHETGREAVSVLTAGGPGLGRRALLFHGQGGAQSQRKTDLEKYFRAVERALHGVLVGENVPLLFAGVRCLFPLYRSINKYPYLLGECIAGNSDLYSHEELRRRAWLLVEPFYNRSREMAAAQFTKLHGTGRASNDTRELVFAAQIGLIDSLFVAIEGERWGVIDQCGRTVEPASANQPHAEELLDYIAVQTFLNRGMVYVVNRRQVPGGELAAAIYRYPPMAI
jgi:hypothetical protein